jgi:hypothetical protein
VGRTPKKKTGTVTGRSVWGGGAGDPVSGQAMTATTIASEPGDSGAGVFAGGNLVAVNSGGGPGAGQLGTVVGDVLAVVGGEHAAPPQAKPATRKVQVCENGRCRIIEVPDAGPGIVTYGVPCQGPACANGACVGVCNGCATGSCGTAGYIGGNPAPLAAYSGCSGGSCAPQRTGWYPGKLLFGR